MATAVVREPQKQIVEDFRKILLEKHPSGWGYASPQEDTLINVQCLLSADVDLKEALEQIEKSYKNDRVFYVFGTDPDNQQPFAILTNGEEAEKEEIYVSAIVEGEFTDYENAPDFVDGFLADQCGQTWEAANGDNEKFVEIMTADSQRKLISDKFGERTVVLIIPYKGSAVEIAKNKEAANFPWGFATRAHGYSEGASATSTKKISIKKPGATAEQKVDHPPGGTTIKPEEHYKPLLNLKDGACQFVIHNGSVMCRTPRGAGMDRVKKYWENHYNGIRPKDAAALFAGFPADQLKINSPIMTLRLKLMGEEPKKAGSIQEEKPDQEQQEQKPEEVSLLIPKEKKDKYLALKKSGKLPHTDIPSLLKTLKDYPAASLQLGEQPSEMLFLSPQARVRIAHDDAHMTACLWHETACIALDLYAQLKEEPTET